MSTATAPETRTATSPADRPTLGELAAQPTHELYAALRLALPGADSSQVAVAAFNSTI